MNIVSGRGLNVGDLCGKCCAHELVSVPCSACDGNGYGEYEVEDGYPGEVDTRVCNTCKAECAVLHCPSCDQEGDDGD